MHVSSSYSINILGIVEVEIATFGFMSPRILASLNFIQPPIELAVDDMNDRYNGSIHFSVRFISFDNKPTDCQTYVQDVAFMVSRWYYIERRTGTIPIIVSDGV